MKGIRSGYDSDDVTLRAANDEVVPVGLSCPLAPERLGSAPSLNSKKRKGNMERNMGFMGVNGGKWWEVRRELSGQVGKVRR